MTLTVCCRVGQIIDVSHHPSAETLYVEQIDLGEEKPRQVLVSGVSLSLYFHFGWATYSRTDISP